MTIRKEYDHPYDAPAADELATCISLLQGAKIRAEKYIANPWGLSWLEEPEQQLIDAASTAIDEAVQNLEALSNVLKRDKDEDE